MTTADGDWKSAERVQAWLSHVEGQPIEKLRRIQEFNAVTDMLPFAPEDRVRVVDLGAGWGALMGAVLTAFPSATGVCLDSSPAMLDLGRERLAQFGERVEFVQGDLDDPGCLRAVEGEIAAIVSSRAIHHVGIEKRKALYGKIYQRLTPIGCFINLDHVLEPDPYLREAYRVFRTREIERIARAAGLEKPTDEMLPQEFPLPSPSHKPGPLVDQLTWLGEVGFRAVDIYWKYLQTAVFGGFKLG